MLASCHADGEAGSLTPALHYVSVSEQQEHISALLSSSSEPLSFVVVVPAWQAQAAWQGLSQSRFTRHRLVIPNRQHGYYEGAQQRSGRDREGERKSGGAGKAERGAKRKMRAATSDTSVFFMRNSAGERKWPVTADALAELSAAFRGVPHVPAADAPASERGRGTQPTAVAEGEAASAAHSSAASGAGSGGGTTVGAGAGSGALAGKRKRRHKHGSGAAAAGSSADAPAPAVPHTATGNRKAKEHKLAKRRRKKSRHSGAT